MAVMGDKPVEAIQFSAGRYERFTYGLYFFGQLLFFSIVTGFLQLYLTDSGIPAALVGGIFAVAKVWDAVNDPIFGIVVDKARLRGGKFIPWIRISTFLIPLATILIFAMPVNASVQVKAIWAAVAYMLWDSAYTFCDVPIFALATAMTDNIKERDWLYMLKGLVTFFGALFALVAIPQMYPGIGWTATAVVLAVIGVITMLPVGYAAKERHSVKDESEPSLRELVKCLFGNKYLLIFNGAVVISAITNTTVAVTGYVAIYCFGSVQFLSVVYIVSALPMLVSILVVGQLIKRVDKLAIYLASTALGLVFGVITYFAGYGSPNLYLALVFIKSLFTAGASALGPMFTADCAEYGHFMTGKRTQGVAFSVQTFTNKMTAALSASIGMLVLGLVGFAEGEGAIQSPGAIAWIWRLNTIVPLISGSIGFLIILFAYKLKERDVAVMAKANEGEISRDEALASLGWE
jgi:sugar (glycoside-pentoside-hexuronide) transporter